MFLSKLWDRRSTSTQIAVRFGAVQTNATVSGGIIPTSGSVTVSFTTGYEPSTSQGPGAVYGSIDGVYGVENVHTSPTTYYTFTASGINNPVTVNGAVPFVISSQAGTTSLVGLCLGRNNFGIGANNLQVLSDLAACVSQCNVNSTRFFILSVLNAQGEGIGTPNYQAITQLNNAISQLYPNNYIDWREFLVSQYNPNVSQDVIDYNDDIPPSSLVVSSSVHPNAKGYTLAASYIYQWFLKNGMANLFNGSPTFQNLTLNGPSTLYGNTFLNWVIGNGTTEEIGPSGNNFYLQMGDGGFIPIIDNSTSQSLGISGNRWNALWIGSGGIFANSIVEGTGYSILPTPGTTPTPGVSESVTFIPVPVASPQVLHFMGGILTP